MQKIYMTFSIYGLTFIILLLPVVLNEFLPLMDISNHIARHYIASTITNDAHLSNFYNYTFTGFGNSTADLIRTIIGKYVSDYNLVRVTIGFYMVNFVFSVCVLYRVIKGHWGLWPLSSILLVFNGNFLWGFENYLIGAPFVLYAIAAMVACDNRMFLVRLLIISAFTFLLFFFHILLGLIFGVAVLGYELQRTFEKPYGARLRYFIRSLSLGLPFILCIGVYIAGQSQVGNIDGSFTSFGDLWLRLDGLASISSLRFHLLFTNQSVWETGAFLTFIYAPVLLMLRNGARLGIETKLKGLLIALLTTSLLMPAWIDGVAFVHYRTPFLLAAVFIASVSFINFSRRQSVAVSIIIITLCCGRLYQFYNTAKQHSLEVIALNQLLEKLPLGAKLMPVIGEKNSKRRRYHSAAFAVVERQALIPTLFQGMHGLTVNPSWKNYATTTVPAVHMLYLTFDEAQSKYIFRRSTPYSYTNNSTLYYDNWEEKFTHVLLINETEIPIETRLPLARIDSTGVFTLYENLKLK